MRHTTRRQAELGLPFRLTHTACLGIVLLDAGLLLELDQSALVGLQTGLVELALLLWGELPLLRHTHTHTQAHKHADMHTSTHARLRRPVDKLCDMCTGVAATRRGCVCVEQSSIRGPTHLAVELQVFLPRPLHLCLQLGRVGDTHIRQRVVVLPFVIL